MTRSCHFCGKSLNGTSVGMPNCRQARIRSSWHSALMAGLPGFDHALRQRPRAVRQRQVVINADDAAEAPAGRAGPDRMVEAEQGGRRLAVFDVALGRNAAGSRRAAVGRILRPARRQRRMLMDGQLAFAEMIGLFAGFDETRAVGVARGAGGPGRR